MLSIPIYTLRVAAIVLTIFAVIVLILWCILQSMYKKSIAYDADNNTVVIINEKENEKTISDDMVFAAKSEKTNKLQWILRITNAVIILSYILAFIFILTYSFMYHEAKKYGAYDAFEQTETIKSILNMKNTSYIEQSQMLPSDNELTGKIIFFYKYNCDDCKSTKKMVTDVLTQYPQADIYFVSSRSNRGGELVARFDIAEVPSAVYLTYDNTSGYEFIYKDFFERQDNGNPMYDENGKNIYTTKYFEELLAMQKTEKEALK